MYSDFENIPCKVFANPSSGMCFGYFLNQQRYVSCRFIDPIDIEDFLLNEEKKESCRYAARNRRSVESQILHDLQETLPFSAVVHKHLGKSAIIRLTNAYLRTRNVIRMLDCDKCSDRKLMEVIVEDRQQFLLKILNGFLLIVSSKGAVSYVSDNLTDFIGISYNDLMGESIYDFVYPCDHHDLRQVLNGSRDCNRTVLIRFKCSISNSGRVLNLKSTSFKVFKFMGRMIKDQDSLNFVFVCRPIPHPINFEQFIDKSVFFSKHSTNMNFCFVDDNLLDLGYSKKHLLNSSFYQYVFTNDIGCVSESFKNLYQKGQCETEQYRLLAKNGGYIWVLTQATILYDKQQVPINIICVHYKLSAIQNDNEVYCIEQLNEVENSSVTVPVTEAEAAEAAVAASGAESSDEDAAVELVETATWKIFGPRTPEMNQGFLTFSDEVPGVTLLKEDPDDLTHLAPTAGDVCVPLENVSSFISPDFFNEFLSKDNLTPFLNELIDSGYYKNQLSSSKQPQTQQQSLNSLQFFDDFSLSSILTPPLSKNSDSDMLSSNASLIDENSLNSYIRISMDESMSAAMAAAAAANDEPKTDEKLSRKSAAAAAAAAYIDLAELANSPKYPLLTSNDLMWSDDTQNNGSNSVRERSFSSSSSSCIEKLLTSSSLSSQSASSGLVNPSKVLGGSNSSCSSTKFNELNGSEQRFLNNKRSHYLNECIGNNSATAASTTTIATSNHQFTNVNRTPTPTTTTTAATTNQHNHKRSKVIVDKTSSTSSSSSSLSSSSGPLRTTVRKISISGRNGNSSTNRNSFNRGNDSIDADEDDGRCNTDTDNNSSTATTGNENDNCRKRKLGATGGSGSGSGSGSGNGNGNSNNNSLKVLNSQSESVLMNLLMTGCDLKAGYFCQPPRNSQKQM